MLKKDEKSIKDNVTASSKTATDATARLEKIDHSSPSQLTLGLVFGIVFGFLLQKEGVAKFHVLE